MFWISLSWRKKKEKFLQEVIKNLRIEDEEKDIYFLSLEVLEEDEFNTFYEKIRVQIDTNDFTTHSRIEPFSSKLL
jgi:hypothetical protein